jgi:FKBP-type peptidyl-prolyl cis-trans isomerase
MMRPLAAIVLLLLSTIAPAVAPAQTVTLNAIPPPADVGAPPSDARKTASGLASKVITPGAGTDRPTPTDLVTVHYTGWTTDGKMFDSSIARGAAATFRVNGVIAGFGEGIQLMTPGEKRRLWIPAALAYKGQAGKPAGMLVFDVELIEIPNRAPADVKAPPKEAMRTVSGLAYVVLKEGVGGRHPNAGGGVTVHYTGWTTDGKMFDSSVVRGQPATFPLGSVIPGWTEGLQLMVEGQKMRFWIPENLAYQGKSSPYGMLVFDVELIKIE